MNFSNLGVNFDKTVQCASFSSASTHVLIGGSKGICMHGIMDNEEEGVVSFNFFNNSKYIS